MATCSNDEMFASNSNTELNPHHSMGLFPGQPFPGALHLNSFFKSDNSTGALCGDGYYTNTSTEKNSILPFLLPKTKDQL